MSKDRSKLNLILVELGSLPFSLKPVVARLNRVQNYLRFGVGDPVPQIGDPDLDSYEYSFSKLSGLASLRRREQEDYVVGITSVPLEGDWFSTSLARSIVITTHDADRFMAEAGLPVEKYVELEIVSNLLASEYYLAGGQEHGLWHPSPMGCIFDFAGIKRDIIRKVREAKIERVCQSKMDIANVAKSLVQACQSILNQVRKTSLTDSAKIALKDPIAGFLLGGVIVSVFLEIIDQAYPLARLYSAVALAVVLIVFVLSIYYRQNRGSKQ